MHNCVDTNVCDDVYVSVYADLCVYVYVHMYMIVCMCMCIFMRKNIGKQVKKYVRENRKNESNA